MSYKNGREGILYIGEDGIWKIISKKVNWIPQPYESSKRPILIFHAHQNISFSMSICHILPKNKKISAFHTPPSILLLFCMQKEGQKKKKKKEAIYEVISIWLTNSFHSLLFVMNRLILQHWNEKLQVWSLLYSRHV